MSFSELLATTVDEDDEEQQAFLDVILENSRRLLRLIEDLLLVAKLELHTLPLSLVDVDLPTLVREAVRELQPQVSDPATLLTFSGKAGPPARCDPLRVQQVLSNLIRNAIAYTPAGGRIDVAAEHDPTDDCWVVTVVDTGIGIEPEDLPLVFNAFYRTAPGQQATTAGTGLGLAIARLIMTAHNGTITCGSTPGVGTMMTVRLPAGGP